MSRRNFLIFIVLLATVFAVVQTIGNGWQEGVKSFAIIVGGWLLLLFLPWRGLELLQATEGDERQDDLTKTAAALTAIVMTFVALGGAAIDTLKGREDGSPYVFMCVVSGCTFLLAMIALPRIPTRR